MFQFLFGYLLGRTLTSRIFWKLIGGLILLGVIIAYLNEIVLVGFWVLVGCVVVAAGYGIYLLIRAYVERHPRGGDDDLYPAELPTQQFPAPDDEVREVAAGAGWTPAPVADPRYSPPVRSYPGQLH